jgi:hypothetical protein
MIPIKSADRTRKEMQDLEAMAAKLLETARKASIGAGPPQRASGDREISGADNRSATPRFVGYGSVAATL